MNGSMSLLSKRARYIVVTLIAAGAAFVPGLFGVRATTSLEAADTSPGSYLKGRVTAVESLEPLEGAEAVLQPFQEVTVRISSGPEKGDEVRAVQYEEIVSGATSDLRPGDRVILLKTEIDGTVEYAITDRYRIPSLLWVFLLFFLLAAVFGRWRGVTAIVGLMFSVGVLALYVVPSILRGGNPLVVSVIGAVIIALFSLYLSHGFNRRTSVALLSTLITLCLSALLAVLFVSLARLSGFGSEEAFYLQVGFGDINMRGLLLGGIILGALGVLDDVTTAQAAVVEELKRANASLGFKELYRRGISVGVEHIASLVNTLALAYFGASLPLFLLFTLDVYQPWWVTINGELVAEELVRTLVGSASLVCAVPIATLVAAHVFSRRRVS